MLLIFYSIFQECDLHRSIYECQAFAFSTRTTFDNCLLSNTYGRSLDTLLETSYGWEVWTYGGVIFPNTNSGGPISSNLQKQDYFSVSGRECLGGRTMDPKARYWYCKTGTYHFLMFGLFNFQPFWGCYKLRGATNRDRATVAIYWFVE